MRWRWRASPLICEASARRRTSSATSRPSPGRYGAAQAFYEQALTQARASGDRTAEGALLDNLGYNGLSLSRYPQAQRWLQAGLRLCRETGWRSGGA